MNVGCRTYALESRGLGLSKLDKVQAASCRVVHLAPSGGSRHVGSRFLVSGMFGTSSGWRLYDDLITHMLK